MANALPKHRQVSVLHHLCEGNTLRSTSRLTGVHRTTITNLMVRFGSHCKLLMDEKLRGLTLGHVQIDETWTYVLKKQARLTLEERAERSDIGDIYLWTCLDTETKLIATHLVGKRSADNARELLDDHAYEQGSYQQIAQISTDAFPGYPEAVDLAFGPYAKYGQIIKNYRNASMNYEPSEMIATERRGIAGIDPNELWTICTSHVERHNLTIRTFMKWFTRLSLGFSKKLENLQAALSGFLAYYNFCWRPRYPDHSGQSGRLRPTPAMMAGVVSKRWHFEDLFDAAMS